MQVPIDKKFETNIKSMLERFKNDKKKELELEFRFGKFEKGFHVGINRNLFVKVLNILNESDNFSIKEETFKVIRYTGNYKQLICSDSRIENIQKYHLDTIDIDYSEFVCRLSLSIDKQVENIPENDKIENECIKHRFTFLHKTGDFKIDLSITDDKYYDIELEYLNRNIKYELLIQSFSIVYSLLSSTKYILPYLERIDVVTQFNSLVSNRLEWVNS